VDDNFCIRQKLALKSFVKDLKQQGLTVKVSEKLMDYLSCSIKFSNDKKQAWIGQLHLIAKFREKFGHLVRDMQSYHTPGMPGQRVVKVQEDWKKISQDEQKLY